MEQAFRLHSHGLPVCQPVSSDFPTNYNALVACRYFQEVFGQSDSGAVPPVTGPRCDLCRSRRDPPTAQDHLFSVRKVVRDKADIREDDAGRAGAARPRLQVEHGRLDTSVLVRRGAGADPPVGVRDALYRELHGAEPGKRRAGDYVCHAKRKKQTVYEEFTYLEIMLFRRAISRFFRRKLQ